jgi:hypothetical protein
MIRQQFLLLLILMMVITPVSSALGYYSTMVSALSAESSLDQSIAATDSADATSDAAAQNSEHCSHQDTFKIACHASGSCTFHVCGDGGISAVFLFTQAYSSHRYGHWEKSVSRSLAFSPEIRPPINSL